MLEDLSSWLGVSCSLSADVSEESSLLCIYFWFATEASAESSFGGWSCWLTADEPESY
ncbi:hypothetical protein [Staphylococcus felis]|uniref:hypothetical protein n=1 Tax=Staphylococcus felis TaxID=46127 RepID=UPI0015F2651A|nr:hypothetical protein [Staphylococcus felis]